MVYQSFQSILSYFLQETQQWLEGCITELMKEGSFKMWFLLVKHFMDCYNSYPHKVRCGCESGCDCGHDVDVSMTDMYVCVCVVSRLCCLTETKQYYDTTNMYSPYG